MATAFTANPDADIPQTGVTRYYDFTIARGQIAPDGVERQALLINGQFPGPMIEANWGDFIQVTVTNNLADQGTSLHCFKFQVGHVVHMAQPTGTGSFKERHHTTMAFHRLAFRASQFGTTWYHAHYSAQYSGGVVGPLIVHGPSSRSCDIDLGPVMLSDWYHKPYEAIVENVVGTDIASLPPHSDSNLINGKNSYDCSLITNGQVCHPNAPLAQFKFESGKTHRLRLINSGADGVQKFSIDNHVMTIISQDFIDIQPYQADVVTLAVGQRTDILVEATGNPTDAVFMRSILVGGAPCGLADQPSALAIIFYEDADQTILPTTTSGVDTTRCTNDDLSLTIPAFPMVPGPADVVANIAINLTINETGHAVWTMNGQTFRANYNNPILLLAKLGNISYPTHPEWNVYNFGENKTIRIVFQNLIPFAHPMHLHGHNMFLLHEGPGAWDGVTITNPDNPARRDTHLLQALGHFAMQITADNPGVWPFHCHIAWHLSGGLYINVMERPADISEMEIPDVMAQTCRDWAAYTNTTVVSQIDAGP
ncbi:hypothetical protein FGG08_004837 [Glutinoglossum americanum]|uniref:Laccase n=1 Tax=Glutinoglossum americanum TaxID=1670608 RepID=A0A9P8I4H1_9PEZI|nr:hypothetical protein FGG08_004837 [Glutinoglossum americanum]